MPITRRHINYINFFASLSSKALLLTTGNVYFVTQKVMESYFGEPPDSSMTISVGVFSAAFSALVMGASRGPKIWDREFNGVRASGSLETANQHYPNAVKFLKGCLWFNAFTLVIGCWYVVNNFYPSAAMELFAILPALYILKVFYAYTRFETIINFARLVNIYRGNETLDRGAAWCTVLTSVLGAVAFSSFVYFVTVPALKELGSIFEVDHWEAFPAIVKGISLIGMLVSFFINIMSRSGKVYGYLSDSGVQDKTVKLKGCGKYVAWLLVVILALELISTVFGYDRSSCELAGDLPSVDQESWLLRGLMLIPALSGTWNHAVFGVIPAWQWLEKQCGTVEEIEPHTPIEPTWYQRFFSPCCMAPHDGTRVTGGASFYNELSMV